MYAVIKNFMNGDKNCDVVKCWMPMPPAPKEEK